MPARVPKRWKLFVKAQRQMRLTAVDGGFARGVGVQAQAHVFHLWGFKAFSVMDEKKRRHRELKTSDLSEKRECQKKKKKALLKNACH